MSRVHASIDIGTHTARLLIARKCGIPGHLMPLARKRAYIRLAEGLSQSENKDIPSVAIDRTLNVLKNFSGYLKRFRVHSVNAVATGEIRNLSLDARLKLPGLDKGRADVILAGCLTVIRILYFFKSLQLKVSLSDLLEGILFESSEGEGND
jgi:exopolyphosphatase/pppGpp-phosphohydrolase